MMVASWDLLEEVEVAGELPPIRFHNITPRPGFRPPNLVNRVWRVKMWARGEDGEQYEKDLRSPRCNLDQIVERTVDELLEACRDKEPLAKAGMRVEVFR